MGRLIFDLGEGYSGDILIRKNSDKRYNRGFNLSRHIDYSFYPRQDFSIRFDNEASAVGIFLFEQTKRKKTLVQTHNIYFMGSCYSGREFR